MCGLIDAIPGDVIHSPGIGPHSGNGFLRTVTKCHNRVQNHYDSVAWLLVLECGMSLLVLVSNRAVEKRVRTFGSLEIFML